MPSNELSRTVGDYFSSLNLGERSSEISSCFERNILLYNLFDRRNRNSSVKTRSNLSWNLFSNRSMTKEAWPTFLEEFLGTMRTKGTVRQVGWQMKFELLTSRFLPSFLCNAQRYFVPRREIHRRRFNAIFANSRTRWSRSFCSQLLRIKIDENLQLKMIVRFLMHYLQIEFVCFDIWINSRFWLKFCSTLMQSLMPTIERPWFS